MGRTGALVAIVAFLTIVAQRRHELRHGMFSERWASPMSDVNVCVWLHVSVGVCVCVCERACVRMLRACCLCLLDVEADEILLIPGYDVFAWSSYICSDGPHHAHRRTSTRLGPTSRLSLPSTMVALPSRRCLHLLSIRYRALAVLQSS